MTDQKATHGDGIDVTPGFSDDLLPSELAELEELRAEVETQETLDDGSDELEDGAGGVDEAEESEQAPGAEMGLEESIRMYEETRDPKYLPDFLRRTRADLISHYNRRYEELAQERAAIQAMRSKEPEEPKQSAAEELEALRLELDNSDDAAFERSIQSYVEKLVSLNRDKLMQEISDRDRRIESMEYEMSKREAAGLMQEIRARKDYSKAVEEKMAELVRESAPWQQAIQSRQGVLDLYEYALVLSGESARAAERQQHTEQLPGRAVPRSTPRGARSTGPARPDTPRTFEDIARGAQATFLER